MAGALPHNRILTQAARDVLRPLGLTQKGRSRTWLDDHEWWLVVVEFQPSSWLRGSYLNVGAMWLWNFEDRPGTIYCAVGHRVADAPMIEFDSEEQFAPEAHQLAIRAASEVERFRARFPDLSAAAAYLESADDESTSHRFDAGIAWGLLGDESAARRCFTRHDKLVRHYAERRKKTDYFQHDAAYYLARTDATLARSHRYQALTVDQSAFTHAVLEVINRNREALRLGRVEQLTRPHSG